jgi:hypothetical protein
MSSLLRPLFLLTPVLASLCAAAFCACTINSTSDGADGGLTSPDAATGADTGVSTGDASTSTNPLGFQPSNLGAFLSTIDLTKLVDIDVMGTSNELSSTCGGNPGCAEGMITQADGSTAMVFVAKSWKIEPGGALPSNGKVPAIIVATGTITVLGRIDGSATGQFTQSGGYQPAVPGPGVGGAGVNGSASAPPIGGGGASYCGLGGAGGQATGTNGIAGKTYGSATLIPLVGGSAGGAGDLASGAGGGALQLVAGVSIEIGASGILSFGGGGGDNGDTAHGTAGGGSGGALLLKAPSVTISGIIEVNGGAGGGGALANSAAIDATPNGQPAVGANAGTTGAGGSGSAGATNSGTAGAPGDALGGANGAGAGGGGSGYIRINTSTGIATLGGTLSPAAGSTCMTQGKIGQ